MRNVEKKAARLVNSGAVRIGYWRTGNDRIEYAVGVVDGTHDTYAVVLEPDRVTCTCEYGINRPGHAHSHTRALELAVWNQARKET